MTFFDLLNRLFFKRIKAGIEDNDYLQMFVPYMMNRWLSFYSGVQCIFVNETLNKYTYIFENNKEESFKFYSNFLPKLPFKVIKYVKKKKEEVTEKDKSLTLYAKNNMISQREVALYLALINRMNN